MLQIQTFLKTLKKIFFRIYNNSLKLKDLFHRVIELWISRFNDIKIQGNWKIWSNFRHFRVHSKLNNLTEKKLYSKHNWRIVVKRKFQSSNLWWIHSWKHFFNVWTYNVFKEKQYLYLPIYHIKDIFVKNKSAITKVRSFTL